MIPRQNGITRLRFQSILRVFREVGSRKKAADMLGIHHNTVERYVKLAEQPREFSTLGDYLAAQESQQISELNALKSEVAMLQARLALSAQYAFPMKGGDSMH